MMDAPDGYTWIRPPEQLRCEACRASVRATEVDIHVRGCDG